MTEEEYATSVSSQSHSTAFAEGKASSVVIPGMMTPILQPLDTSMIHQALATTVADDTDYDGQPTQEAIPKSSRVRFDGNVEVRQISHAK